MFSGKSVRHKDSQNTRTVSHLLLFLRTVRYSAQGKDSCSTRLGAGRPAEVVFGREKTDLVVEGKFLGRYVHRSR